MPAHVIGRRAVAAIAVALLSVGIGPLAAHGRGRADQAVVEALLGGLGPARAIGRRYLDQAPEERDSRAVRRHLFGDRTMSLGELRADMNRRRADDFACGDTVLIDGWILARTEARLCALAVLL